MSDPTSPAEAFSVPVVSTGAAGVTAPPVVYVPVEQAPDGSVGDITMLRLGDGRIALVAYTALDRFIDAWGEQKAWALVQTSALAEIHRVKPFDLKLLDVDIPEAVRTASPEGALR